MAVQRGMLPGVQDSGPKTTPPARPRQGQPPSARVFVKVLFSAPQRSEATPRGRSQGRTLDAGLRGDFGKVRPQARRPLVAAPSRRCTSPPARLTAPGVGAASAGGSRGAHRARGQRDLTGRSR